MDRLFTMDEEDKINLKVETPLAISRIQLRKEMSMSLKPLTKESDEDNASQSILYGIFPFTPICLFDCQIHAHCCFSFE